MGVERTLSIEGTVFLNVSFPRLVYHGEISLHVFIPALKRAVRISGFADVCPKLPTQQPFDSRTHPRRRHSPGLPRFNYSHRRGASKDTQVDKSSLTGESKPVEKWRGPT